MAPRRSPRLERSFERVERTPTPRGDLFDLLRRVDSFLEVSGTKSSGLGRPPAVIELKLARDRVETQILKLGAYADGLVSARKELVEACSEMERALLRARGATNSRDDRSP